MKKNSWSVKIKSKNNNGVPDKIGIYFGTHGVCGQFKKNMVEVNSINYWIIAKYIKKKNRETFCQISKL